MRIKEIVKYRAVEVLIAMFIILIPFNNLPYLNNVLKELSYFASSYIVLILMVVFLYNVIRDRDIKEYTDKIFYVFLIFIGWGLISGIFNFSSIINNTFKGRTGLKRFIFQFPLISFSFIAAYILFYFIKKKNIDIYKIRRYIFISAIITATYSIFEVLYLLNILDTSFILKRVSSVIQLYSRGEVYIRGVRSITAEASYFSMYAAFVFPWLFSYIYTERKIVNKLLFSGFNLYFIMLVFLSRSRIGLAVFGLEFFILILSIFIIKKNKEYKIISLTIIVSLILLVLLVNNVYYKDNAYENTATKISISSLINSLKDPNNLSNVSRFSLQDGAISMGIENPLTGVGIGQFGFHITKHINQDAYRSFEITKWLDVNQLQYWPTVFSLHARIIGELGFIGFGIWIVMWIMALFRLIKKYIKEKDVMTLAILVSTIGALISGMNSDTFINYPLWIMLSLVVVVCNKKNEECGEDFEV